MSGVLFVSRVKHLKEDMKLGEALIKGAVTQFKPRLMTIILTAKVWIRYSATFGHSYCRWSCDEAFFSTFCFTFALCSGL